MNLKLTMVQANLGLHNRPYIQVLLRDYFFPKLRDEFNYTERMIHDILLSFSIFCRNTQLKNQG